MTTYLGKSCSFGLPRVPLVNCRQFIYLVISLLVLRAGCWILLYQFLIIAYLFTFQSSRSCETQLISFIQDLAQSANRNIQTDIIIMDFAKAFNNVSHRHLLYKLSFYGINNNALLWISDFLNQRTQTVFLKEKNLALSLLHQVSPKRQSLVLYFS